MILALVGNPNCGKTTLFNQLTGANQHTGNFPGVTIEQKSGVIRRHRDLTVVDLPGVYSLSPYTSEETITRNFVLKKPDGIINIIDSTNIERNLYLTLQLIELNIPMVLALNMIDEFYGNGGSIKIAEFSKEIGVPVIPVSAIKGRGIDELIETAAETVNNAVKPVHTGFYKGAVRGAVGDITSLIEDNTKKIGLPTRFAAAKLIEDDAFIKRALNLNGDEKRIIELCVKEMELNLNADREAAMADMRYTYIESLCNKTVNKPPESREELRSTKIDKLLTHKYLGIPMFLGIMLAIFWLTFSVIGNALSQILILGIESLSNSAERTMQEFSIRPVVQDLIINGVFAGVGAVVRFLPPIITLFFFLSILEDSGYMARVSFVMDRPLRKLGLSGKSFVPMLIGFGCSVPAIMAARTLSGARDKKMTILLIPFMSCSAKLPIYALMSAAFFPEYSALVMMALYITGILMGILIGVLFKETLFWGETAPFVMEQIGRAHV